MVHCKAVFHVHSMYPRRWSRSDLLTVGKKVLDPKKKPKRKTALWDSYTIECMHASDYNVVRKPDAGVEPAALRLIRMG